MNLKDLLKSFPIINQLVDALSDYPLITGGFFLVLAGLVPYSGLENANALQEYLAAFALFVYSGGSIWDFLDKHQNPDQE